MELRQHLGVLILAILICFLKWLFFSEDAKKEFKWYISIGAGIILMVIFEVFYWTVVLCFL